MALDSDSINLLFRAKGDTSDAQKAFKDFHKEIDALEKDAKTTGSAMEKVAASVGLSAKQFTDLTLGVTAAAGAVAAIAGTLFKFAESAERLGSQIHDLSEQTGLSAETMSALKVAADQSGSSIEQVSKGITRFSLLMGEAAAGSDKAKEKLAALGVTSADLDTAFAQAVKTIFLLPPGVAQATAASDAFGKKLGADLIPLINQFQGDLPGLIAEVKRLGLIVGTDAANAADKFGDQMDTLKKQLAGVGVQIGNELLPIFTQFANEMSEWLAKNQGEVKSWGKTIAGTLDDLMLKFHQDEADLKSIWASLYVAWANSLGRIGDPLGINAAKADAYAKTAQFEAEKQGFDVRNPNLRGMPTANTAAEEVMPGNTNTGQYIPLTPAQIALQKAADDKAAEDAKKRAKDREDAFKKELSAQTEQASILLKGEHDAFMDAQKALEEQFQKGESTAEQYRTAALKNIQGFISNSQRLLDKHKDLNLVGKTGTARDNVILEFQQASEALGRVRAKEVEDLAKTITAKEKQELDKSVENTKQANAIKLRLGKAYGETYLLQVKDLLDNQFITEKQYIEMVAEARIAALRQEQALTDDKTRKEEIEQEIVRIGIELRRERQRVASEENQKQLEQEIKLLDDKLKKLKEIDDEQKQFLMSQGLVPGYDRNGNPTTKTAEQPDPFANLKKSLADLHDRMLAVIGLKNVIAQFGQIGIAAFNGLANAVGGAIEQWALYGGSLGKALKQALAAELAHVAGIAVINALYATALGFLRLAQWDFVGAGHAFVSAGMWAALAGGSALAARAVAGNSFQQQADQATGNTASQSSSSGNGGTVYSLRPDATATGTINRNVPQIRLALEIHSNDSHIVSVVRGNVRNNGELRTVIQDAAAV